MKQLYKILTGCNGKYGDFDEFDGVFLSGDFNFRLDPKLPKTTLFKNLKQNNIGPLMKFDELRRLINLNQDTFLKGYTEAGKIHFK